MARLAGIHIITIMSTKLDPKQVSSPYPYFQGQDAVQFSVSPSLQGQDAAHFCCGMFCPKNSGRACFRNIGNLECSVIRRKQSFKLAFRQDRAPAFVLLGAVDASVPCEINIQHGSGG